jgi:anti-sigma-K factor RskA
MNLDDQLKALGETERMVEAPAHLESRLLEAFDEGQRSEVRSQRAGQKAGQRSSGQRYAALALAAGIVVGVASSIVYFNRPAETPTLQAEPVGESVVFVVGSPGEQETMRAVRIRVSRSALESLGIQTVASEGDSVEVDVLVGEDGVARGVRLAM